MLTYNIILVFEFEQFMDGYEHNDVKSLKSIERQRHSNLHFGKLMK